MQIVLNAFPLAVPTESIQAISVPYDRDSLEDLRSRYRSTHAFRRQGDVVYAFPGDHPLPVEGTLHTISPVDDAGVFCFLVKDALTRHFAALGRRPLGFNPIGLISSRPADNLLAPILGASYPFQVRLQYTLDTRLIRGQPCLVIDCSTRRVVVDNCAHFIEARFDLTGRYVAIEKEDGYRKVIGKVTSTSRSSLQLVASDGEVVTVDPSTVYLEASRANFDDFLAYTKGTEADAFNERIRVSISRFNGGQSKKSRIEVLKRYIQSHDIPLLVGPRVQIEDAPNIQRACAQIQRPMFVFNDRGETMSADGGLTQYGPYTKRTFDRNNPSICVICSELDKGRVDQFVRKLLKGMPNSKYFKNGLEGKFALGTSRVEYFGVPTDDATAYKRGIETALGKKRDDGGRWDLALVQVRQSFKKRKVTDNPYYVGKSLFFLHQVPVQDFTMELLSQNDTSLGYSLNNMGLACYAKMGGVPWLLKSSPTLSHELVIGIGSANIGDHRSGDVHRVMGITTVFSGDGSYLVSSVSRAVRQAEYRNALTTVLGDTIEKIRTRMNWQVGDTIRLVFHVQVKRFNDAEVAAVRSVVERYRDYHIEYAFLKISEDHGLHMFDDATAEEAKGRLAPLRGKTFELSEREMLVYLIGQRELRQASDGHPRGIVLNVHQSSTFKDIKYLASQLFGFAAHSWRSYFPNPLPVTISYSDLIAKNLGWLNELPGWSDSVMIGKIGQSQWFL